LHAQLVPTLMRPKSRIQTLWGVKNVIQVMYVLAVRKHL